MQALYRIVDIDSQETLAEGMVTETQAREQLVLLQLDYPHCVLEIESYLRSKPSHAD